MNETTGAMAILDALAVHGVRHVFANPGTTELAFVPALRDHPELEAVLVVDETVASGAADGVARMTGRPGATLVHLGPGLVNAAANVHNANKAHSPMLTIVGDHALGHRDLPSPLQTDIAALARQLSAWVGTVGPDGGAGALAATAARAATAHRANATLIVPADLAAARAECAAAAPVDDARPVPADRAVELAAAAVREGGAALLLGGEALRAGALRHAAAVAAAWGADLWAPMFNARVERTVPVVLRKLPYFPAQAAEVLGRYRAVIRVGADLPVAMFAYPSEPHLLAPGELVLAGPADDASVAMELLASALGVTPAHASSAAGPDRPPAPGERLDVFSLAAAIGATLPAGAIVVDEGQTSSLGLWDALAAVPHDLLALTGGAIGGGPPLAVGAALAAPGRRVVNLEGDGSALYSLGAWWTQASRQLDVTTVIAGNGGYTILDLELGRSDLGHLAGGPLTSLRSADLDFVALAAGYGVPGVRVADGPALVAALRDSFASPGPRVIHAVL